MRIATTWNFAIATTAIFAIGCSSAETASGAPATGPGDGGAPPLASDAAAPATGQPDAAPVTSDAGTGGNGTQDATPPASVYPAGPFGVTVGAVIANMMWTGYANPTADAISTTKPYGAYSLDDARKSGKRFAIINLAESMCPGCQKSAREFRTEGKALSDAGGLIIEVLETTGFTKQPTKSDLDAWVNRYELPVTTVKDLDGSGTPTLDALGPRERAYIVDLATMKILQIIAGDNTGLGATSGGKAMAAVRTLLGK